MKIKSLEIRNFRGVKTLTLDFNYENVVIWGPNGAGKSAVVDAIDFVLTGDIPRLTGEGTQGATLAKHGPHIDHVKTAETATVIATVSVPGCDGPVKLTRSVSDSDNLKIDGADSSMLAAIFQLAERKQHSLSRKEILKYITAQTAKRSEGIQHVLDLSELEATRKGIVQAANKAKSAHKAANTNLGGLEETLGTSLDIEKYTDAAALKAINKLRVLLGATKLSDMPANSAKEGVSRPEGAGDGKKVNPQLLERSVRAVTETSPEMVDRICSFDKELRKEIATAQKDVIAVRIHSKLQLLETGIGMLDESGECPLCGHEWKPELLEKTIQSRLEKAKKVAPLLQQIEEKTQLIKKQVVSLRGWLIEVSKAAANLEMNEQRESLEKWAEKLETFEGCCDSPLEEYLESELDGVMLRSVFANGDFFEDCKKTLKTAVERAPNVSPEETAWDILTKLDGTLPQYSKAAKQHKRTSALRERAATLSKGFDTAREDLLGKLYDSIKCRFAELYKSLHAEDESVFDATLEANGKLLVDFYGRGQHPPFALHSEGHQDSMGLCLYLALAERLTENKCQLTVLDDVVMSVDAEHRRDVCRILKEYFPNRQFLITTHDKTWAKQLLTEGVVKRKGAFEFSSWSIDTGPSIELESDLFAKIEQELKRNDAVGAATQLRNGCERFFETVCDSLGAEIRYKSSYRWELGDYMNAALTKFKSLLKKAKVAEQSWGSKDKVEVLNKLDDSRKRVVEKAMLEQWSVNATVHFSKLLELSASDLRPIVGAYNDCFQLFYCQDCGSMIRVIEEDKRPTSVRCSCNQINWNLVERNKK